MIKLKWFGQACFLLTSDAGTRVFMDPFSKILGYRVPEIEADIVTTSHDHFDHNYLKAAKGDFIHINKPGKYTHKDIDITGTLTYHNKHKRTKNIIYNFKVDGIQLCHSGDLGHLLTLDQVCSIGKVNILLINVGGVGVIKATEVFKVCKQLNPDITIPMHFRTKALGWKGFIFAKVDKFLKVVGEQVREVQELSVDSVNIMNYAGIVVLKY